MIVTGAADGLGRATSLAAARAGYATLLVDIDVERLRETERLVSAAGGRAVVTEANVSRPEDVKRYVATALDAFGRIDGLFNNAGILGPSAAMIDYPEDDFDRVIAVNLKGVYLGLKYVMPVMIAQGSGSIVNTGSMASAGGVPLLTAYAAAKHGVIGLTRTAALEVARDGVRVNAVLPGNIKTKMPHRGAVGTAVEDFNTVAASLVPQGWMGEASDIADAVVFLVSDQARHITGVCLPVDGGITAQVYPGFRTSD